MARRGEVTSRSYAVSDVVNRLYDRKTSLSLTLWRTSREVDQYSGETCCRDRERVKARSVKGITEALPESERQRATKIADPVERNVRKGETDRFIIWCEEYSNDGPILR